MEFYNCADISILGTGDTVPANVPGNSQPEQSIRDAVSKALQAGMRASMGNPTSSLPPKVGAPVIDPKRGPKPLSGQNVNPSTLANGMPNTSTREASALDMLRRNMLSNNNARQSGSMGVREPVMTDLSSMFARGNGMNSANMASAFRNSLMQQYRQALPFSTGRNAQSSFAAASPLSSLLSTLSPNRQNTRLQQLAMNNMASGSLLKYLQLLQNASNSAGNMTQNRRINDLTQLLTQGSQRSLRGGLNMPIVERMINLQGLMSDSTVNRSRNANMVANAQSTLLSPSGERGMTGGAPTASAFGSNFAPGNQFSRLASLLGGGSGTGAPNMALTPELLMMSSLLGRSGGSGGSEAGEGGGTSRVNPLMMLNPELGMMTSLLGRGTQRGGEGSEGGQRSTGMHSGPMNPQMKALATLFGTSSRPGGEGAMGGRSSSGFGLSSLFGMNARGGAEVAEGGRSSSRMGFASLFGGRSTAGGEGGEGGRTSGGLNTMSMMLPLLMGSNSGFGGIGSSRNMGLTGGNPFGPVNPVGSNAELMLLSSFLGHGSRGGGGGEGAEGGEAGGRGMGGMSNLPLLAMMLGDGFGRRPMARQQMPGLNTAQGALLQQRPQTKPYGGLALPGMKPLNMPPMLKGGSLSPIPPPLLGTPLSRGSVMRRAQMRSPLMPTTGMNAMQSGRFARSRSPSVSLLDLYRLTGSLGGRRQSRMID